MDEEKNIIFTHSKKQILCGQIPKIPLYFKSFLETAFK